jgi:uncharacterized membrane protein YvbJ
MSLTKCTDCDYEVSGDAEFCPKCGFPIASSGLASTQGREVRHIDHHTSKQFRLQKRLSWFLMIACVILMIAGGSSGSQSRSNVASFSVLGLIAGSIWFIVVRFLTWWKD